MNNTPWRLAIAVDGDGGMVGATQAEGKRPQAVAGTSASSVASAAAKKNGRTAPAEILLVHPAWMNLDQIGEQVGALGDVGVDTRLVRTRSDVAVFRAIDMAAKKKPGARGGTGVEGRQGEIVVVDAITGRVTTGAAAGGGYFGERPGEARFHSGSGALGDTVDEVRRLMREYGAFTTEVILVGPPEATAPMEKRLADLVSGPAHLSPRDLAIGALDPGAVKPLPTSSAPGGGGRSGKGMAIIASVALAIGAGIWGAEFIEDRTPGDSGGSVGAADFLDPRSGIDEVAEPDVDSLPPAPERPADGTSVPDMMAHYFTGFDPRPILPPADECGANDAKLAENIHLFCSGMSDEWAGVEATIPGLVFRNPGIPQVNVSLTAHGLDDADGECFIDRDRFLPVAEGFRAIVSEPCDADGVPYPPDAWPEGEDADLTIFHVAGAVRGPDGAPMYPKLEIRSLGTAGSAQAILDFFGIAA